MTQDEHMMMRCVRLAHHAKGHGNTAVGSLITIGDDIVAEASEESPAGTDRFGHAEIIAVRLATARLGRKQFPEATMYTTAEPCFLCGYAIREAAIGRVVFGVPTPHIGSVTSRYPVLLAENIPFWSDPPIVATDVLSSVCATLKLSA